MGFFDIFHKLFTFEFWFAFLQKGSLFFLIILSLILIIYLFYFIFVYLKLWIINLKFSLKFIYTFLNLSKNTYLRALIEKIKFFKFLLFPIKWLFNLIINPKKSGNNIKQINKTYLITIILVGLVFIFLIGLFIYALLIT